MEKEIDNSCRIRITEQPCRKALELGHLTAVELSELSEEAFGFGDLSFSDCS